MKRFEINRHFPRFGYQHHPEIAAERRAELHRDIETYLKAGGKIEKIPTGLSGLNKNAMSAHYAEQRAQTAKRGARATAGA